MEICSGPLSWLILRDKIVSINRAETYVSTYMTRERKERVTRNLSSLMRKLPDILRGFQVEPEPWFLGVRTDH